MKSVCTRSCSFYSPIQPIEYFCFNFLVFIQKQSLEGWIKTNTKQLEKHISVLLPYKLKHSRVAYETD